MMNRREFLVTGVTGIAAASCGIEDEIEETQYKVRKLKE